MLSTQETWFPYTIQVYVNGHDWVTEQAEYASDVIFSDRSKLPDLFPRLLDHALVNFSAGEFLTFPGRKLTGNFLGQVLTGCRKQRASGARVKHQVNENWIKMYDKSGLVLCVETVIDSPREFRVRGKRTRNGRLQMVWYPMNQCVANVPSHQRVCRAANDCYLNALSVVNDPTPADQQVADLTESKVSRGRRFAGFNPARRDDVLLFQAVLSGAQAFRGFHNSDIRTSLSWDSRDPWERRRQANRVSRMLKRLHVHRLIAKIPGTRHWRVRKQGHTLLGSIVWLHDH